MSLFDKYLRFGTQYKYLTPSSGDIVTGLPAGAEAAKVIVIESATTEPSTLQLILTAVDGADYVIKNTLSIDISVAVSPGVGAVSIPATSNSFITRIDGGWETIDTNAIDLDITALTSLGSEPDGGDLFVIYDDSAGVNKSVSYSDLQIALSTLGGDVTGEPGSNTVNSIQNNAVSSTSPTDTQVLTWSTSNNQWEPQAVTLSIPGLTAANPALIDTLAFYKSATGNRKTTISNFFSTLFPVGGTGDVRFDGTNLTLKSVAGASAVVVEASGFDFKNAFLYNTYGSLVVSSASNTAATYTKLGGSQTWGNSTIISNGASHDAMIFASSTGGTHRYIKIGPFDPTTSYLPGFSNVASTANVIQWTTTSGVPSDFHLASSTAPIYGQNNTVGEWRLSEHAVRYSNVISEQITAGTTRLLTVGYQSTTANFVRHMYFRIKCIFTGIWGSNLTIVYNLEGYLSNTHLGPGFGVFTVMNGTTLYNGPGASITFPTPLATSPSAETITVTAPSVSLSLFATYIIESWAISNKEGF